MTDGIPQLPRQISIPDNLSFPESIELLRSSTHDLIDGVYDFLLSVSETDAFARALWGNIRESSVIEQHAIEWAREPYQSEIMVTWHGVPLPRMNIDLINMQLALFDDAMRRFQPAFHRVRGIVNRATIECINGSCGQSVCEAINNFASRVMTATIAATDDLTPPNERMVGWRLGMPHPFTASNWLWVTSKLMVEFIMDQDFSHPDNLRVMVNAELDHCVNGFILGEIEFSGDIPAVNALPPTSIPPIEGDELPQDPAIGRAKRNRRPGTDKVKTLTTKQLEAVRLHGELKGNMTEVGRTMGISRQAAKQHYDQANAKLGIIASKTAKTFQWRDGRK